MTAPDPTATRAEEGAAHCGHCGAVLTAEEAEFYGNGCERCESELHAAMQEERAPILPPPNDEVADLRARAATAEAEVERLTRERDEADKEHTSMMWQRRRADERTEAAEARVAVLKERHGRLLVAFHDAIRRPLGVTPDSGAEFYDPGMADQAEERRPRAAQGEGGDGGA